MRKKVLACVSLMLVSGTEDTSMARAARSLCARARHPAARPRSAQAHRADEKGRVWS
jgi:hypothetical protein